MAALPALSGVTLPTWVIGLKDPLKLAFSLKLWLLKTNKRHLLKNRDF